MAVAFGLPVTHFPWVLVLLGMGFEAIYIFYALNPENAVELLQLERRQDIRDSTAWTVTAVCREILRDGDYNLRHWAVDGQNQNVHCRQICLVAMVVAVEVLAAAKKGRSPSIWIAPLTALEAFLKSKLPTFVEAFGTFFGCGEEQLDAQLASEAF